MKNRTEIDELAAKVFLPELAGFKDYRRIWGKAFAAGQLEMKEDMTLLIEWLQNHPHVLEKSAEEVIERFYLL